MKKYIYTAITLCLFMSCSKEEDKKNNSADALEQKVKELKNNQEVVDTTVILKESLNTKKSQYNNEIEIPQQLIEDDQALRYEKYLRQKAEIINPNNHYLVNGSVENPVYFHNTPNDNDRRKARFTTNELVYVLEVQNYFAYVEFTNSDNKTSKGWIKIDFLD